MLYNKFIVNCTYAYEGMNESHMWCLPTQIIFNHESTTSFRTNGWPRQRCCSTRPTTPASSPTPPSWWTVAATTDASGSTSPTTAGPRASSQGACPPQVRRPNLGYFVSFLRRVWGTKAKDYKAILGMLFAAAFSIISQFLCNNPTWEVTEV